MNYAIAIHKGLSAIACHLGHISDSLLRLTVLLEEKHRAEKDKVQQESEFIHHERADGYSVCLMFQSGVPGTASSCKNLFRPEVNKDLCRQCRHDIPE
jgi:hypothetical protein